MEMDVKKMIAREGMIFLWVSAMALVLTLVSVWPVLYNYCWEICFNVLLPVYGLYFCVGVIRLVFWASKALKKQFPKAGVKPTA